MTGRQQQRYRRLGLPLQPHSDLTTKTITRLRQVVKAIKAHPDLFDMGTWCNSHACLAGFAVVEFDPKEWVSYRKGITALAKRFNELKDQDYENFQYVQNYAAELLGLSDNQAVLLFIPDHWPAEFTEEYVTAQDSEATALAVEHRVEHFIKTGR